ncbi:hypothetical protein XENOCAPTIV_023514, partial [Xenoophorus captivus]
VLIFFTLDGSKPGGEHQGSDGSSRKYTDPIVLPAGRVSVRAVAVTSSTFIVLLFQHQSETFYSVHHSASSAQRSAGTFRQPTYAPVHNCSFLHCCPHSESRLSGRRPPPSGHRFLNRRLSPKGSSTPPAGWVSSSRRSRSADSHELKHLRSAQGSREERVNNFLWYRPNETHPLCCPQEAL